MRRRVLVQRWPAVPTAPKTAPGMAIFRSALPEIMMALFPPSSSRALPRRAATAVPTALPIRVEPVAESRGMRESAASHSPVSRPPVTSPLTPSGTLLAASPEAAIYGQARAQSGGFSDGVQSRGLRDSEAIWVFQLQA